MINSQAVTFKELTAYKTTIKSKTKIHKGLLALACMFRFTVATTKQHCSVIDTNSKSCKSIYIVMASILRIHLCICSQYICVCVCVLTSPIKQWPPHDFRKNENLLKSSSSAEPN
jgi:hypothetical protein